MPESSKVYELVEVVDRNKNARLPSPVKQNQDPKGSFFCLFN